MKKMKKFLLSFLVLLCVTAVPVFADEAEDAAMQEYYQQLMGETQSIESQLEATAEQMYEEYFATATLEDVEYYKDNTIGVLKRWKALALISRAIFLVNISPSKAPMQKL